MSAQAIDHIKSLLTRKGWQFENIELSWLHPPPPPPLPLPPPRPPHNSDAFFTGGEAVPVRPHGAAEEGGRSEGEGSKRIIGHLVWARGFHSRACLRDSGARLRHPPRNTDARIFEIFVMRRLPRGSGVPSAGSRWQFVWRASDTSRRPPPREPVIPALCAPP